MLEEAVNELAGQQAAITAPVRVDLPVTAFVPPEYIAYEATKIDAHRRIARARTEGELGDVRAELADRFGAPPEPVEDLISLQAIRIKAGELGAGAVVYRGKRLQVDGIDLDDDWAARVRTSNDRATYFKKDRMLAVHRDGAEEPLLRWVEATLDAILGSRVSDDPSSTPGRVRL
jgi:transcription-repair coupling factor (superfamily II helicase)